MEPLGQPWNNIWNRKKDLFSCDQRSITPLMRGVASFCALRRATAT
jgi:hypothetical protein